MGSTPTANPTPASTHRVCSDVAREQEHDRGESYREAVTAHAGDKGEQEIDGDLEQRAQPLRQVDAQPWSKVRHGGALNEQNTHPADEEYLLREMEEVRGLRQSMG